MGSDETWPRRGCVLGGKFLVGETLGEGGMAIVVAATDRKTARRIALKLPRPERRRPADLERFEREAKAIGALASQHLPRVYETGTLPDGVPYIALEYLEGIDLATLLSTRTLDPAAAAEIIGQACRALAVAHAAGIVHRDLKPANLFLTASSGRVVVKLLDFGICRTQAPTGATTTGTLLGSPAYMPPERMRPSATVDARGDQWSLGIVLFEMVAGRRPFDAPAFPDLCLQILLDDVPPLDAPDAFVRIIQRCLAKEPDARFTDVAALADALAPLARPIDPAELGIASPQRTTPRRRWTRVAAALGATAAIGIALARVGEDREPSAPASPIEAATRVEPVRSSTDPRRADVHAAPREQALPAREPSPRVYARPAKATRSKPAAEPVAEPARPMSPEPAASPPTDPLASPF